MHVDLMVNLGGGLFLINLVPLFFDFFFYYYYLFCYVKTSFWCVA